MELFAPSCKEKAQVFFESERCSNYGISVCVYVRVRVCVCACACVRACDMPM